MVSIVGGSSSTLKRATGDKQAERLEEDIAILGKISSMADTLLTPHQVTSLELLYMSMYFIYCEKGTTIERREFFA